MVTVKLMVKVNVVVIVVVMVMVKVMVMIYSCTVRRNCTAVSTAGRRGSWTGRGTE